MTSKVLVLGAGIAGISAGFHLKKIGIETDVSVIEKSNSWGGLCDNFEIDGFRFDKFVHLSFSNDEYVNKLFTENTEYIAHLPESNNYYKGVWLKHPAQNNLFNLSATEKTAIIKDFINREDVDVEDIKNYEQWLKCQYGDYFAENFAMVYTKKYWTVNANELETKWVGNRMYKPTIDEVLMGAFSDETPNTYYAKEMRYPVKGGYKTFIKYMAEQVDIRTNTEVISIDLDKKEVEFNNGKKEKYDKLISSIPLTEICKLIKNIPTNVYEASENLRWTSGAIISLGFNKPDIAKKLWSYIYDEDIKTSRIYSPSLKSKDNAPDGCSSIQAEIYFSFDDLDNIDLDELLETEINNFINMGLFNKEDIVIKDIRVEEYANIIFDNEIYSNREIIRKYMNEVEIYNIGRFGEWEYFWSDQSLLSGKKCAELFI